MLWWLDGAWAEAEEGGGGGGSDVGGDRRLAAGPPAVDVGDDAPGQVEGEGQGDVSLSAFRSLLSDDGAAAEATNGAADGATEGPESGRMSEEAAESEASALRAELVAERSKALAAYRRALLAENVGRVIPELVVGENIEALDASLAVAATAYERVRAATVAELGAAASVSASNGASGGALDVEGLSPMGKIAYGLKRG